MFLCENCHNEDNHLAMFRSRGLCEGCRRTANCIDCHYGDCRPKGKKREQTKAVQGEAPKKD